MDKKGFTLVEILAVIALIGVVSLLIIPNIVKTFNDTTDKTMKVQEKEVSEAGLLYLEDFCKNPINGNRCPSSFTRSSDYKYSGTVSLSTLISNKYIEEVTLNEKECNGCVVFTDNKAEAYLICGDANDPDYKSDSYRCN